MPSRFFCSLFKLESSLDKSSPIVIQALPSHHIFTVRPDALHLAFDIPTRNTLLVCQGLPACLLDSADQAAKILRRSSQYDTNGSSVFVRAWPQLAVPTISRTSFNLASRSNFLTLCSSRDHMCFVSSPASREPTLMSLTSASTTTITSLRLELIHWCQFALPLLIATLSLCPVSQ